MSMKELLSSKSSQSAMRVGFFTVIFILAFNLAAVPIFIWAAIKSNYELSWLPGYVMALGGGGLGAFIGKAVQKKYEPLDDLPISYHRRDDIQPGEGGMNGNLEDLR